MTTARLLLTMTVALAPATAWGQPVPDGWPQQQQQQPKRINRNGTEVFRWMLDRGGLKPMTPAEEFEAIRSQNFSDIVVIVLGPWQNAAWQQPGNFPIPGWVTMAAENGGAVLVANDQNSSVSLGGNQPSVHFSGQRVITPPPAFGEWLVLNGDPQAQFAVPLAPPPGGGPLWKLFGGDQPLRRVVNEYPSTLYVPQGAVQVLTPLAGYPPNARIQRTGEPVTAEHSFSAGTTGRRNGRQYRFLAIADHAVFLNEQMVGPTDNLEFTDRVVTFLTEEGGVKQQRKRCLLFKDGKVDRNYDELNQLLRPPLPPLPKPDWEKLQPKLVDLGNQIIDKVQENDILNRALVGKNPDEPGSWYRTLLGVLLTMAALAPLVMWAFWARLAMLSRVWRALFPIREDAAPPGGRPPPPPDGAAGVFGRRSKELTSRDNLLEPARAACRDFFDTVGRPPDPGPRLPKVVISDVVRKPDTLRQALRDIWAVAYGRPAPVSAMRWAALEPLLTRALDAHRDRKWRFVEAEAWPDVSTRSRGEA